MADERDLRARGTRGARTDEDRGAFEGAGDEEARRRRQRDEEWSETARDRPSVTRHETSSRDLARRELPRRRGEADVAGGREPKTRGSQGQWDSPNYFGASREVRGGSRAETYASEGYGYQQAGVESPSRQRRAFGEGDDHYRSWRDRQLAEYDRDYEAFCRQRQEKFNADFAAWRSQRQAGGEGSAEPIRETSGHTAEGGSPDAASLPPERTRRPTGGRRKQ